MGNPFAPRSMKFRGPERAPDLPPLLRLRRAGLRPDEEPEVLARWASMTNAERLEAGESLEYLDDDEVRRQVEEMREDAAASAAVAEYAEPEPVPIKPRRTRKKA